MPTTRALAGSLASQWFGRTESVGHELLRKGQSVGLFAKGVGGGFGNAPGAASGEAVMLFLALAAGPVGPRAALCEALALFSLEPLGRAHCRRDGGLVAPSPGVAFRQETPLPGIESFGHHLSRIVAGYRLHAEDTVEQVTITRSGCALYGRIESRAVRHDETGEEYTADSYSAPLNPRLVDARAAGCYLRRWSREYSGSLLAELAAQLGAHDATLSPQEIASGELLKLDRQRAAELIQRLSDDPSLLVAESEGAP